MKVEHKKLKNQIKLINKELKQNDKDTADNINFCIKQTTKILNKLAECEKKLEKLLNKVENS